MGRLPKIGNGALVAPEQVLLLHKPGPNKRQRVHIEPKDEQQDEIVFKKKKEISKDWWKDPAEVGKEVQEKTVRRLDKTDINIPVNKTKDLKQTDTTSAEREVSLKPKTEDIDIQNGYHESDRKVRFEKSPVKTAKVFKPIHKDLKQKDKHSVKISVPNESDKSIETTNVRKNVFHADPIESSEKVEQNCSNNKVQTKPNRNSVQARVRKARERARVWAETCSDPGKSTTNNVTNQSDHQDQTDVIIKDIEGDGDSKTNKKKKVVELKAIHNDSVLRGRPHEQRKGRTINEIPRPRPAPDPSERQKLIERGRRLPPSKKDPHASGPDPRSVASAPSKEQPPMKGPMPQINTLVSQDRGSPVKPSPRVDKPQQPKQDRVSPKVSDNVKPSPRAESPKQKQAMPRKKQDDTLAEEREDETSSRHSRPSKLPPDDHGPVSQPTDKRVSPTVSDSRSSAQPKPSGDDNFKYYASEKEREAQKQQALKVPPLEIQSEKNNRTDRSRTMNVAQKSKPTDHKSQSSSTSPSKSERSKTVDMSRPTETSEVPKKRREVTIVDPRSAPEGDEPFLHEFVFGHHDRIKNFDEMDDEEKADYFKNTLKLRPEQIRELTFHPKVNEAKVIHNTYAGSDLVNWKAPNSARKKSARGQPNKITKVYKKVQTVEPYKRKSFMLSRLQGVIYKHINKVYGNSPRHNREKHFFEKLAHIQMDDYRRRYNQLEEKEKKWLESNYRQRQQLQHVRKKFEDDAWRRFMTQYVTSKVLEAEYKDREEYGLPNNVRELPTQPRSKRDPPISKSPYKQKAANKKKFKTMFKFTGGPTLQKKQDDMKFEGFDPEYDDTDDEQGNTSPRRNNVEEIMREAKQLLNQSDGSDIEDSTPTRIPKQKRPTKYSDRRALSDKSERPARHRSRDWRGSDGGSMPSNRSKSRSKSRNRPAPKTMKEVIETKRNKVPTQVRYRASNFESMKKDLLKDSALLDKSMKKKSTEVKPKVKKITEPAVKSSDTPKVEQKETKDNTKYETDVPSSPQKTSVITTTTVTTTTTKTHVTNGQPDADTVSKTSYKVNQRVENYLDNTETQMGLETAREQVVTADNKAESVKGTPQNKSPDQKPESAPKPTDNSSMKRTPSRIAVSRTSMQSKQKTPELNGTKQASRAPSRLSINNKLVNNDNKANRAPSRLSILNKQNKDNDEESQTQKTGSRAPSRLSIQSLYGKSENKQIVRRNSQLSPQNQENTPVQNGRMSRASISKTKQPGDKDSITNNTTGRMSRTSQMISNKEHVASENIKNKTNSPVVVNGDIHNVKQNGSEQIEPAIDNHIENNRTLKNAKSTSPSQTKPAESVPSPSVKTEKHVHVADVVNEVIHDTRTRERKPINKVDSTKRESRPKAPKVKTIRARSPPGQHGKMNGYNDTKIKSDDYERKGQGRPTRTHRRSGSRGRSDSKGRRRSGSRSRERNRSVSRDRKGQSKRKVNSRFPEIDKSGRLSSLSNGKGKSKTKRSVNVEEHVTEREVTPTSEGPKQWKDLVQKYLRQPSPKVGKTEDRALLEAPLDTEDEDDDIDIFERAKKRYLLDSDEESI